jgi:hypothetical protein
MTLKMYVEYDDEELQEAHERTNGWLSLWVAPILDGRVIATRRSGDRFVIADLMEARSKLPGRHHDRVDNAKVLTRPQ